MFPREIENNSLCKIRGGGTVYYGNGNSARYASLLICYVFKFNCEMLFIRFIRVNFILGFWIVFGYRVYWGFRCTGVRYIRASLHFMTERISLNQHRAVTGRSFIQYNRF